MFLDIWMLCGKCVGGGVTNMLDLGGLPPSVLSVLVPEPINACHELLCKAGGASQGVTAGTHILPQRRTHAQATVF